MKYERNSNPPFSRKIAWIILITIAIPILFIFALLLIFGLIWVIPFLLLGIIMLIGVIYKKRPEFFAALRKPGKSAAPVSDAPQAFTPSSAKHTYVMLVSISVAGNQQIAVNSSPFVIGRAPDCDFCIHDSHVSHQHLVLEYVEAEKLCYATDVSYNGSYLNSLRMQGNQRRPLHQGDTLQIAGLMFRVEYVHF